MKIPMSAPLVAPQGGYSTGAKAGVSAGGRTDACLRALIDACPDSVVTADERGRIVQFNQTAEVTFGYARSEILGWPLSRLVVPDVIGDDLAKALKRPGQLCGSDAILNHPIEAAALHRDGTQFTTELVILRFSMEGQTFLNACFHDLCNRRRVEMELRKLAAVTRLNPNALVEFTQDGSVTYFNDAALTLALALGQSDPARIVPQDTAGIVKHCLAEGRPCEAHECVIGERTLSWSFYPNAASAVVHGYGCDVTDKRRLEEQFLRAQRLESIGTLASGIAHDLNNILAPILMSVNLLEETQKDDANARLLDTLRLSTQRGAEMVKQILSFTRGHEGGRTLINLKHLLAETCKIARSTFPSSIQIDANAAKELWPIIADTTQMHQVLMNLCVNARDAMPDGGYLQIQAENLTLDEKSALRPDGAPPGPYVLVTVSDTGSGIPPEALEKIWEPFFTLKPHGKGSGIGLSTVREIVRSHSGFVGVTTEQGKGTRFRIFLPVAEHVTASLLTEPPEALPVGEGETILVIDDERAFQEITKAIFNRHGYRVITASDGTEAVAAFTNVTKKIHLVVTDMVMPYLDGPSTIRALRRLDPQLPIIATSGLSEGEQIASQIPDVRFLLKPFTTETLLTTVHQSLRPNQKAP